MSIADCGSKLGQQKSFMVPRSLKGILRKSDAPLSLLDCLVLKKYPDYSLEFFNADLNANNAANI